MNNLSLHPRGETASSSTKTSWAVALAGIALLIAHKPWALTTPQLWAEDGVVHLFENEQLGAQALLAPHRGYLHTLPRLVAWLASHTVDVAHWPAFYNGAALLVTFLLFLRLASPRCDLPGKNWLVLSFALAAHTGDVFFNITNLHWITAFFLLLQTLLPRPVTWGQRLGDLALVFLVGLTGPFVILFLPLFAWRFVRERNADTLAALLVAGACAAIQAYFVKTTGAAYFAQPPEPFSLAKMLTVAGSRLVVWPLFGTHVASTLSWAALRGIGAGFIALLLVWALRPHPRRWMRAHLVVAFVLFTTTVLYRIRADTWAQPDLVNADSYFFIPRLLLAWLLIWELDARPRAVAWAARGLCVVAVMLQFPDHVKPAPKDLHWEETCGAIRRGVPAKIPILPEGWFIPYPGRPRQMLPAAAVSSYRPVLPSVAGDVLDHFSAGGVSPGGALLTATPARTWSSWDRTGGATGSVVLGPFPAPEILCFAVGGYPREPGNHLFIEFVATHDRIDARPPNPGAHWQVLELPVPETWRGQPIMVFTIDGATTHDGWLAISEPLQK